MENNSEKKHEAECNFETFLIGLKLNDNVYDFGRFVIDYFNCPVHGCFEKYHCFFDKEIIKSSVLKAREDNQGATKGLIIIFYRFADCEYNISVGEYNLGSVGFNYKVKVDEKRLENTILSIKKMEGKDD